MLKLVIAILGATLIDGSGRAPIKNSVVVIEGDQIVIKASDLERGGRFF